MKKDITIVGSGICGAALACSLKSSGLSITVIDPFKPSVLPSQLSNRVVSLIPSSLNFLNQLGISNYLAHDRIFPFKEMITYQDTAKLQFNSKLRNTDTMGYIVENANLHLALYKRMQELDIEIIHSKVTEITRENDFPVLHVDGIKVKTNVLVGADGGSSLVKEFAGIGTVGWDYHQKGIVAQLVIDQQDNATAWQRFLSTGPIALLPVIL